MSEARKVVEAYYSPALVGVLLGFSAKWVLERVKAGDFGGQCVYVQGDFRIPASGVNAWLDRHRVQVPEPVPARTVGELRRKLERKLECPDV